MSAATRVYPDFILVAGEAVPPSDVEPGLSRKVLAYNDKLFLAEHRMREGWVGALHSHPHEQVVYVVSGHLRVRCEGKQYDVRAGGSFLVRGGVEHAASAMEDSVVIDVFTPCRQDYIPG